MNTDASDRVAPRFDRKKVNFLKAKEKLVLIKKTKSVGVSSCEASC